MKILVLPGDGIGPEITEATLAVLNRANDKYRLGLEWQMDDIGLVMGDTDLTADAGKSSASRQTFVSGKATELAALDLRRKIFAAAGLTARVPEPFLFEDYPRGNGNNYPANFRLHPETGFHFALTRASLP